MSEKKCNHNDERMKELKAFDDTRLGVKGLIDSGIANVPKIFVSPRLEENSDHGQNSNNIQVPVIDLHNRHETIIKEIKIASESWGIFQLVNHGIPISVINNMIKGIRDFNEQDIKAKTEFYNRDMGRIVKFYSNYDLYNSKTVSWRDTLAISMIESDQIDPLDLPSCCRISTMEYIDHVKELGNKVFDLLSEGLDLNPDYLRSMDCNEGKRLSCHYYPDCPEPDLAIGMEKHSDNTFITILAQDQIGGLQVLHQNKYWIDVSPVPGAIIINIGDFLQLVSNDKFKSCTHRVLPSFKSRVSAAFFFLGHITPPRRPYGPIKELISHELPPKYKQIHLRDHIAKSFSLGPQNLDEYRL